MAGFRSSTPTGGPLAGDSILFPRIKPILSPPNERPDYDYAQPLPSPGKPGAPRIPYPEMPLAGIPEKEYLLGEKPYPKYEDPQQIYDPNRLSNPEGGK